MIRVPDLETAKIFYVSTFGMLPQWQDENSCGLKFAESDTEIVLHMDDKIPDPVDVTYLVKDVKKDVEVFKEKGCTIVAEPFEVTIGFCAVIRDPFGISLSIIDLSKGLRRNNLQELSKS